MCTQALTLYREWNEALLNIDIAQNTYDALIDGARLRKTPTCAEIQDIIQTRNNLHKAMIHEDAVFSRLEGANFTDPTFKGKGRKMSARSQKKPPATVLKQIYGGNRKLRPKK